MQTEIRPWRSLLYRPSRQHLAGRDIPQFASMAKYNAGRLSMKIPNECLQFWGGQGVMTENWISRAYRDLRQTAIGGGANEIMLEVIAKTMGIHRAERWERTKPSKGLAPCGDGPSPRAARPRAAGASRIRTAGSRTRA